MPTVETRVIEQPKNFDSMFKRVFIGFIKVVLYLAFVAAAIYYTPKILSKELNTNFPLAAITSGSMWPVLKTNDLILMKGLAGADAQIGQIIVYKNSKGFTIHRLIRRNGNMLVTRGDANDVDDQPITESQVIGRVVYIGKNPVRVPLLGAVARNLGPSIQKIENQ
jgi:signal peptidase I